MPTLEDENLRDIEQDTAEHPDAGFTLNPAERAAFDQISAGINTDAPRDSSVATHSSALPEFDPNKRLEKGSTDGEENADAHQKKQTDPGGMNYNPGSLSSLRGAGVVGGAAIAAKMVGAFIGRNKKKLAGGGVAASLIITGVFYGGSLGMVYLDKNAEKKLDGLSQSIFEKEIGDLTVGNLTLRRSLMSGKNLRQNLDKLDASMAKSGYKLLPSGELELPDGKIVSEASEVSSAVRKAAKDAMPVKSFKGLRARSATSKALTKKIGVARKAAIDTDLKAEEDADTKAKEQLRGGIHDTPEGDSEQLKRNKLGDDVDGETKKSVDQGNELADELKDGTKDVSRGSENNLSRLSAAAEELDDTALDSVKKGAGKSVSSRVGSLLKSDIIEVGEISCRLGTAARTIYITALINKKVNLIKLFGVFSNNAGAIVTGQVNSDVLNGVMSTVWTNPSSGRPITDSVGVQNIVNQSPDATPSEGTMSFFRTDRQDAGGFMNFLIKIASYSLFKEVCKVIDNPIAVAALSVGELAGEAVLATFTGGAGTAAKKGGIEGIKLAIREVGQSLTGKVMVRALGTAAAFEAGGALAEMWMQSYISSVFSSTMVTFSSGEGGPFMGDAFSAGAGAYYEMSGRAVGMRPLSKSAYLQQMKDVRETQRTELAEKSLYQRFVSLDYRDTDSLAAHAFMGAPIAFGSPKQTFTNLASALFKNSPIQSATKLATTATSGSAYAQDGGVKTDSNGYVVDTWGNFIVGNNFDNINHIENFETLVSEGQVSESGEIVSGKALDEYIKECTDLDIKKEEATNDVKSQCVSAEAKKYQSYLVFSGFAETLDAGFNPQIPTSAASSSGSTSAPTGTVTQDQTELTSGCGGVRVHKMIKTNVEALCAAAASAGLNLTGGGWRDPQEQIRLREKHCGSGHYNIYLRPSGECSPPTARPGTSNHEKGVAIDFANCNTRSTACYQWLEKNAAQFGLINFPKEPWHWSVDGK